MLLHGCVGCISIFFYTYVGLNYALYEEIQLIVDLLFFNEHFLWLTSLSLNAIGNNFQKICGEISCQNRHLIDESLPYVVVDFLSQIVRQRINHVIALLAIVFFVALMPILEIFSHLHLQIMPHTSMSQMSGK